MSYWPPQHGWTVPPPPGPPNRPIRTSRVFAGIGLAVLGQVAAVGLGVFGIYLSSAGSTATEMLGWWVAILPELALFVACLLLGIRWIQRGDRGLGVGLLIGWAVTVLVFPVVGIGVCIAILNQNANL